jgi:hypothetical protein
MKSGRKPGGRSPDAVSLQRRKDIWHLHGLGWGNRHIARRLTIHHGLVAYYLKTGPASPAARRRRGARATGSSTLTRWTGWPGRHRARHER